jgi:uncharacterized protein (DUF305 family)
VTTIAAPPTGGEAAEDDTEPERWWHAPWRLAVLGLAVAFLAGAVGFAVGARAADDQPNAVDVGFLQDMRFHHDQAVTMSLLMVKKPLDDGLPTVRQIAEELLLGQQIESGVMVGLLARWGRPEANESGTAMAWMDEPVPLDRMPGLATKANLDQLIAARGAEADQLFLRLMIAHHEGGLHMAEHAASHAATAETRDFAAAMVRNQRHEIAEMRTFLTA